MQLGVVEAETRASHRRVRPATQMAQTVLVQPGLHPASLLGRVFGLVRLRLTARWAPLADRWEKWGLGGLGDECWPPTFGLCAKDAGKILFPGEQEPEPLDAIELAGFQDTQH